jgi:hypothetical protein
MRPTKRIQHLGFVASVVATVLTVTIGCAANGVTGDPLAEVTDDRPRLTVANRHWQEMRVYLVHGHVSHRTPIGMLHGGMRKAFSLPRAAMGNEVRLLLQPVSGRTEAFLTRPFVVAGPRVELFIENILTRSRVYVP